ncbi:helix-turn-helix transcriptional regulator [Tomitella cavernea]|nr:LuxR C-terminal-related transcriptional regulator [Tomitella cavernea]
MPGGPGPGASATGTPGPAGRPGQALPKPSLSAREVEVLLSWFQSESKAAVSEKLGLAPGTVSTYLSRIRVKYELVGRTANSKAALVARAVQDGLVTLDEL